MKPSLIIENEVYRKVMHWVDKSPVEVSGFGTVKVEKDGLIRVVSAMLLPQKNGATHTDIEGDALAKAMFDLKDADGEMKWWWHSHVNMGVFWSSTDHKAMRDFAGQGDDHWICCTVFNKKREHKSAYYGPSGAVSPWGKNALFYDDCDLKIAEHKEAANPEWDDEYKKNVTDLQYKPTVYTPSVYTPRHYEPGPYVSKGGWAGYAKELDKRLSEERAQATVRALAGLTPEQVKLAGQATNAKDRGVGVTKKQWKLIRGIYQELKPGHKNLLPPEEESLGTVVGDDDDSLIDDSAPDGDLKDWGLPNETIQLLFAQGWCDDDVYSCIDQGLELGAIVSLAEQGFGPEEVEDLFEQGFHPTQLQHVAGKVLSSSFRRFGG